MMMSPPRPPSPPEGPPRGTNFSRRKAMQPLPPSPAFTRITASSINMPRFDCTGGGGDSTKPRALALRRGLASGRHFRHGGYPPVDLLFTQLLDLCGDIP